jgi:protein phosphatase
MENPEAGEMPTMPAFFTAIDGMGGYKGGEVAAQIVASTLSEAAGTLPDISSEAQGREILVDLLEKAAEEMQSRVEENPELSSMGATLGGVLLTSEDLFVYNCGDCRVYRLLEGSLQKLSHDHSEVQELVDAGALKEEKMRLHIRKNIVTSAIQAGLGPSKTPLFFKKYPRIPGERLLLCSDGVWEALGTQDLVQCLAEETLQQASKQLQQNLLQTDCRDNITFILIEGK